MELKKPRPRNGRGSGLKLDGRILYTKGCFEHFLDGGRQAALAAAVVPGLSCDVVGAGADALAFGSLKDFDIDGTTTFETDIFLIVPVDGFLCVDVLSHNKSSL